MIVTAGILALLTLLGVVEPADAVLIFGAFHTAHGALIVLFGGPEFSVGRGLAEMWVGVMITLAAVTYL